MAKKGSHQTKHLRKSKKGKVFPAGRGKGYPDPKIQKINKIQKEINKLIFDPEQIQTDPEILTIVILKEKAHHFDFLKGYTEWGVKGRWEALDEKNYQIEIQFNDTKKEAVGARLKTLLRNYNKLVVGEDLLYFRTTPIEETSL